MNRHVSVKDHIQLFPKDTCIIKWGVGVDIEELEKVQKAILNKRFVERTFTKKEIEYSISKGNLIVHYAGTFAAKEAVYKAVNQTLSKNIDISSIEILHNSSSVPYVRLKKSFRDNAKNLEIKVSISHSGNYAIAIAFAKQIQTKI